MAQTWTNQRQRSQPVSALPANEISLWKWQEHAVYTRISLRTVQKLRLDAGGSYVIDDEPSTRHEARDHFLVDLGVVLRGLNIGEAKRDLLETGRVIESIAMNDLDRTRRAGAGDVFSSQSDFLFIKIDRRERHTSRTGGQRQPQTGVAAAAAELEKCALRRRHRQEREAAPDGHGNTAKRWLIACRLFLERAHHL